MSKKTKQKVRRSVATRRTNTSAVLVGAQSMCRTRSQLLKQTDFCHVKWAIPILKKADSRQFLTSTSFPSWKRLLNVYFLTLQFKKKMWLLSQYELLFDCDPIHQLVHTQASSGLSKLTEGSWHIHCESTHHLEERQQSKSRHKATWRDQNEYEHFRCCWPGPTRGIVDYNRN